MENNVIEFPRAVSARKMLRERMSSQRLVTGLSLLSVVMICTFLNQVISTSQGTANTSLRGMASVQRPEDISQQLQKLDSTQTISAAGRPSRLDQLVVGELKGLVHVEMDGLRIVHLDWDRGLENVPTKEEALRLVERYKDQFADGKPVLSFHDNGALSSISIVK